MTDQRQALRRLISRSGRLLDEGDFSGYAGLFAPDGEYRLEAAGPEVAQAMTWILLNRDELAALLGSAAKHVWNTGLRKHLIAVDDVELEGERAAASATFCVFRTDAAGATSVYAVGSYDDEWSFAEGHWCLRRRVARVQTRALTPPSAMPL